MLTGPDQVTGKALRTVSEWLLRITMALLAAAVVADGGNLLRKARSL
ncbi:MAG TPA: hypothetical protein VFD07_04365 [Candidatus Krumholzibacteria bacterium]|nr:hypothetical protein [Candidatus Krumholzibacteria bacterium]